MNKYMN